MITLRCNMNNIKDISKVYCALLKKGIASWEIVRVRVAWPMIVPVPPTFEENAMERSIIALNSVDHKKIKSRNDNQMSSLIT